MKFANSSLEIEPCGAFRSTIDWTSARETAEVLQPHNFVRQFVHCRERVQQRQTQSESERLDEFRIGDDRFEAFFGP